MISLESLRNPSGSNPVSRSPSAWARGYLPRLEALEDRYAPATFTVLNSDDAGAGSLRQAVLDANTTSGADTVVFEASLSGTITLTCGQLTVNEP